MFDGINATILYTVNYGELFVSVPGVVVAGWVGFGIFILLAVLVVVWYLMGWVCQTQDAYELCAFAVVMVVVYLLTALEQFIILRDDHLHVNLLMSVTNAIVWLWFVIGSIRKVDEQILPQMEWYKRRYAMAIGIGAQVLYVGAALCSGGVVYFLWAFGLVGMLAALAHYIVPITKDWATVNKYARAWAVGSILYTILYAFIAFLSHVFLAAMSVPAAVWTYLFMHFVAFAGLTTLQRIRTSGSSGLPHHIPRNGRSGSPELNIKDLD